MVSWADTEGVQLEPHNNIRAATDRSASLPLSDRTLLSLYNGTHFVISQIPLVNRLLQLPRLSDCVPESWKGRKKEGLEEFVNRYDMGLAASSYLALPAAAELANQVISAPMCGLFDYAPTCGLLYDHMFSLSDNYDLTAHAPIMYDLYSTATSLLPPVLIATASLDDMVANAYDKICDTSNTIAQRMETPIEHAKTLFSVAAWVPRKLIQAGTAVYNYGPLQRTRRAIQAFNQPVVPVTKK